MPLYPHIDADGFRSLYVLLASLLTLRDDTYKLPGYTNAERPTISPGVLRAANEVTHKENSEFPHPRSYRFLSNHPKRSERIRADFQDRDQNVSESH